MAKGPSQQQTQTSRTSMDPMQQANVNMLLGGARDYYLGGGPQYYQGDTYAGPTSEQIAAQNMATNWAQGPGQAFVNQAVAGDKFWLDPKNIFNPDNIPGFRESQLGVTDQLTQNLTRNIIPGISQGDIMTGGLGGSRGEIGRGLAAGETSDAISRALSGMEMQAYGMGQNMYNQAANRAPDMWNLGLAPAQTMAGVGEQKQEWGQAEIDELMKKFNFEELAPLFNLQTLQSLTGTAGQYGGTNTSTGTTSQTGGDSGVMQGIGSIITLAAMIWSHSKFKEDVVPAGRILEKLSELGIFHWKYTGEDIQHIGPMAEDFQRIFQVGDGVTLHLFDLMGVLLGAVKELGERVAPQGAVS